MPDRKPEPQFVKNERNTMSFEQLSHRKIRHFAVYKSGQLALVLKDTSGLLISTASPAPTGYPRHPFLTGEARNAVFESELRMVLEDSDSFDDFVKKLLLKEYDILSVDESPLPLRIDTAYRIFSNGNLAGVIWNIKGQPASLLFQPEEGVLSDNHSAVTVYLESETGKITGLISQTPNFKAMVEALKKMGYELYIIR